MDRRKNFRNRWSLWASSLALIRSFFQSLMSGGVQSPHFLQWMLVHQQLMASTVAANIQRLRASQHFHHEAAAVPGNGVGRDDDDDDGDDDVVEGDEDGDEDGSFVDRDEDRKCDSPISESEPEAASQD